MKALAINGSPRKRGNTSAVLKKSLEGAASQGCETELVYLYGLNFKGCNGCNRCKLIGGESYGKCALNDELTPILKEIYDTDILILGSPVYLATTTGEMRCFLERLIYPRLMSESDKNIIIGFIYTLGASETQANERGVMNSLNFTNGTQMERVGLQTTETLFVYNAHSLLMFQNIFQKLLFITL